MKIIKIEKEPGFYLKVENEKIALINNRAKEIKITKKLLDKYPAVEEVIEKVINNKNK